MYNLRRNNYFDELFKMKYYLYIICVSLLLYQSIDLFNEFMSGTTVTTISYGIIRNTTLPAITICPHNLDFRKMSMLNENVLKLYDKYLKIIENANRSYISDVGGNLFDIYLDALEIFFDSKIPNININNDILENLTPYKNHMNETIFNMVNIQYSTAHGEIDNDLIRINNDSYRMISLPIESIKINRFENVIFVKKCYTLFSHLNSSWNNINIDFEDIFIDFKLDPHSHPIYPSMSIPIKMHSPNTLPLENYNSVGLGYNYFIVYSQWNIERLGKGYDTDCREYDPKVYTRSDCIFDCYQDIVRNHCQTQDYVESTILRRKTYFQQRNFNLSKCAVSDKLYYEVVKLCDDQCHKECHFTYYSFTVSKSVENNVYSHSSLTFTHNEMPDITIEYIPEMPLLTYICNFGGILGMWLGLSFYSMMEDIWKIFHVNILSKFISTNIFICTKNIFFTSRHVNTRRISQPRNI